MTPEEFMNFSRSTCNGMLDYPFTIIAKNLKSGKYIEYQRSPSLEQARLDVRTAKLFAGSHNMSFQIFEVSLVAKEVSSEAPLTDS